MADGTEFEIDIGVQAAGVEPAAAKLATLADQLTKAGAASTAAASAVRTGEASYKAAEAGADRMAKAVESITIKANAQRDVLAKAVANGGIFSAPAQRAAAALEKMEKAQADAAAKATAAKATLTAEAAALDKLRASAQAAEKEETRLKKATEAAKTTAAEAEKAAAKAAGTGNAKQIAGGLGKLGGPLGKLGKDVFGTKAAFDKLGKSLGAAGPYVAIAVALTAVAVGMAAITAAAAAGILKIAAWAVGLADANRSASLLSQGIARSVAGGEQLDAAFDNLLDKVPLSREELSGMASELANAGLRGKDLTNALQNSAIKAAQLKFGPNFQKQLLSLDSQAQRFHRNISNVFGGLKIDPLLEKLYQLGDLLDTNTSSGRAIKAVFESIFQPLIDGATAFLPKARTAFIQFEIMVLKALISIKPWGTTILYVVGAFIALGAILAGAVALAIGVVVFSMAVLAFGISVVVAAVAAVIAGLVYLGIKLSEIPKFIASIDLVSVGKNMIDGLVNGIKSGAAAVLSAITGVVGGAVDAAKKKLGIASPSKVFADIGMNTGAGMQQGIEGSTGDVHGAVQEMASPEAAMKAASVPPTAKPTSGASTSSGGGSNLQGATFNFYGVEGAQDAVARFKEMLSMSFEELQTHLGAQVPG